MKSNFKIIENYALELNGKHLDLHNNFDFAGFSFDVRSRQLLLKWMNSEERWVPAGNPQGLELTVNEVSFLRVTPRANEFPFTEDTCLMDITYYPSSERQEDENVIWQELPNPNDDLILRFQSGQIIRVKGENIQCDLESSKQ